MEGIPRKTDKKEADIVAPISEDVIANHIKKLLDSVIQGYIDEDLQKEELEQIHKELKRCSIFNIYEDSKNGLIPNFKHFDSNINKLESLTTNIEDREVAEEVKIKIERLRIKASDIRKWSKRYVRSIARFHSIGSLSSAFSMTKEDKILAIEKADSERRRLHEALMKTLRTTAKEIGELLEELSDYGSIEEDRSKYVLAWQNGDTIDEDDERMVVLSGSAIDNRNLVRDWAIANDFYSQLEHIRKEFDKQNQEDD